jgi:hypothetical protein
VHDNGFFFKAEKDWKTALIPWVLLVILSIPFVYSAYQRFWSDCLILLVAILLQQSLFFALFRSTHYTLTSEELVCRSLIFKRRIPYTSIRKIEHSNNMYVGLKMSTAFRGLVIHYNTYDELFITPAEKDRFIESLKLKHEGIIVS